MLPIGTASERKALSHPQIEAVDGLVKRFELAPHTRMALINDLPHWIAIYEAYKQVEKEGTTRRNERREIESIRKLSNKLANLIGGAFTTSSTPVRSVAS